MFVAFRNLCLNALNSSASRQLHSTAVFKAGLPSLHKKRFYKKVGWVQSNGEFEITLDSRKLKTPAGKIFRVSNEPLAMVVANEWDAQHQKILVSSMHITSLCNTILDNPNKLLKYDIVSHILSYLDNDTLLCREDHSGSEWYEEQQRQWDPLINWFCKRYCVTLEPSSLITGPVISSESREVIWKHLHSYDIWTLNGLMFGVEAVKSLVVLLACIDRHISIEEGVRLSTLETEFQTRRWGRVEWAHDVDTYELQSRFAASVLFVHLLSSSTAVDGKLKQSI